MPYSSKDAQRDYIRKYQSSVVGKENSRKRSREWRGRNRQKCRSAQKIAYRKLKQNPEAYARYLKMVRDARRERYQLDSIFRIYCNARSRIRMALNRGRNQKHGTTQKLLGCSILELKSHLESQFIEGMSWDNKTLWHIDHIRSCASFDFADDNQVKQCFHYTNLRPMWGNDNREKWAHFDGYHHESVSHRKRNKKGQFLQNG